MKKAAGLLCCGALALLMTGCNFSETLSNIVLRNDPGHEEYLSLSESNKENEDGQYAEPETEEVTQDHTGKVHVTFAESNWLEIRYYDDEGKKNEIDTENCYLDPGTLVYAEGKPMVADSGTDSYSLAGFRLALFSEGGEDPEDEENSGDTDISKQISGDFRDFSADEPIKIPADLKENEGIGIVPISEHGTIVRLSPPKRGGTITYFVNGEEILDDTVIIKPNDELTADFKEDDFFVKNIHDGAKWKIDKNDPEKIIFSDDNENFIGVDDIFVLSEEHKPDMTVKLHKSCGTEATFDITQEAIGGGDGDEEKLVEGGKFEKKFLNQNTEIFSDNVDPTRDLKIYVNNWNPSSEDEKMRLTIDTTLADEEELSDTLYLTSEQKSVTISKRNDKPEVAQINITIDKVN